MTFSVKCGQWDLTSFWAGAHRGPVQWPLWSYAAFSLSLKDSRCTQTWTCFTAMLTHLHTVPQLSGPTCEKVRLVMGPQNQSLWDGYELQWSPRCPDCLLGEVWGEAARHPSCASESPGHHSQQLLPGSLMCCPPALKSTRAAVPEMCSQLPFSLCLKVTYLWIWFAPMELLLVSCLRLDLARVSLSSVIQSKGKLCGELDF